MKKTIFLGVTIVALSIFCTNVCMANYEMDKTTSTMTAASTRSVDVWHISGNVTYKVKAGGVYDSNACTLTVEGKTYSVQYNPSYQKANGNKGKYEYCANGVYYFNL